ncbi:MAG: acetyl-CoA carboxylase biotin carboxyl carrier protein subunit [bacterium]|nr:acetyl-CoA carboxylase biotin carboxyl carrier protein subunit [bacterium]
MTKKTYFNLNNNSIEIEYQENLENNTINILKIDTFSENNYNYNNLEIINYKNNDNYSEIIFKIQDKVKKAFILDNNIYILEDNLVKCTTIESIDNKLKFINYNLTETVDNISTTISHNIKNNVKEEEDRYYLVPPLSGKIEKINTKEGEILEPNTTVIIISAMKMENSIEIFEKYRVIKILVKEGDFVQINQNLIELEPLD